MFLRQEMPYILNIKRKTMMCEHVGISLVLLFHGFKIPDPKFWTSIDICSTHISQFPFPNFFLSLAYLDETNYEQGLQGECLTNTTWNVLYFKDMLCIHDSHVYLKCCSWWPKLGKSLLWVESEMFLSDSCGWTPGPQLVVLFQEVVKLHHRAFSSDCQSLWATLEPRPASEFLSSSWPAKM